MLGSHGLLLAAVLVVHCPRRGMRQLYVGRPLLALKRLPGCENPDAGPMG